MLVVRYRKIWYALTALFIAASIVAVAVFGLQVGIDFTGGTLIEVSYQDSRPERQQIEQRLNSLPIGAFTVQGSGTDNYLVRTRSLTEEERQAVTSALSLNGESQVVVERVNTIGPVIGEELRNKALLAIAVVIVAIILFVAYAFRKVSRPISSWKYGLIAIAALLHDIMIPVGVFAVLGYLFGAEVDVLFVMALLTILGYSVNDTIVVFDRVRENLRSNEERNIKEDFELVVGKSLNQTFARSINTSFTTLLVLVALFFFGSTATQDFALVLFTGIVAGAYSSICFATPLLVTLERWQAKKLAASKQLANES